MQTIIVFCHLRWNFVFQRPQHLLTQLSQHYQIIVVEEPIFNEGECYLKYEQPASNITVCQPHTAVREPGFHDDQIPVLLPMMATLVQGIDAPIVWLYTPMALPLLPALNAQLLIYDCMDELSAFKNAPKQVLQREAALLKSADLVFTGGPSLYEAKRTRHHDVHCFPSSVDADHFGQAIARTDDHPLQSNLPYPRLGFFGVIDERLDIDLLTALADSHPLWQIILVGPVVKIAYSTLPQRSNIHYFGQQDYLDLPRFLSGWDVCLMPFALNESTRFISPTKVLEYMAAELPVVSTAIKDVVVPYGGLVAIAHNPAEFIAACEAALALGVDQRAAEAKKMRDVVSQTSWKKTAKAMIALLDVALRKKAQLTTAASTHTAAAQLASNWDDKINSLKPLPAPHLVGCAIIGAGPTGLSAAYHLGSDTVLLERNSSVGGWCRSIQDNGFTFDHAGHIMFSNDPYVLKLYDILLGNNQHWQLREAWVYSKQTFTRYPFQGALYGLPPEVIKECIVGAIDARYELPAPFPHCPVNAVEDCCADGTADVANATSSAKIGSSGPQNFEDFIYRVWGAGIAKHFAIPYNRKLWTVPLTQMETSWLGGRVPLPNLEEIIDGALRPVTKPMGPNARFGYPRKGGFQALMSGFLPYIRGDVELNADIVQILPKEHILVLEDGRRYRYENLISTMPLPELVKLVGSQAPAAIHNAAKGLRHVSIRCVNLGIDRPNLTDKHWIYYPEETIFHRIFVQGNASPECNAPGGFGFTCEISYSPWKPLPLDGSDLIARCIADCIKVGMISEQDKVIAANLIDMPYAYVVYDHARAENVATIRHWMEQQDITLAGRYSEWEYYNSDHAFLAGKKAAELIASKEEKAWKMAQS